MSQNGRRHRRESNSRKRKHRKGEAIESEREEAQNFRSEATEKGGSN